MNVGEPETEIEKALDALDQATMIMPWLSYHREVLAEAIAKGQEEAAAGDALADDVEDLMGALGDPCDYDHHGYCQSHFLHEKPCPVEKVKEHLPAYRKSRKGD